MVKQSTTESPFLPLCIHPSTRTWPVISFQIKHWPCSPSAGCRCQPPQRLVCVPGWSERAPSWQSVPAQPAGTSPASAVPAAAPAPCWPPATHRHQGERGPSSDKPFMKETSLRLYTQTPGWTGPSSDKPLTKETSLRLYTQTTGWMRPSSDKPLMKETSLRLYTQTPGWTGALFRQTFHEGNLFKTVHTDTRVNGGPLQTNLSWRKPL